MTSIFLRALRVFGPERQMRKVAEECAECSAAAIRYLDNSSDDAVADHFAGSLLELSELIGVNRKSIERVFHTGGCLLDGEKVVAA